MKYDREKLYKEVWKEPVSTVAQRYGVSDTALAKACRRLNVPLPPRGYWTKVKAGMHVKIPSMPPSEKKKPMESIKETNRKPKQMTKDTKQLGEEKLRKRINAFLRTHMVEKQDIIYQFKFLISCLNGENYVEYSDEYKKRRTLFLQDCIRTIKTVHLSTLLEPWVFYDCLESNSGFKISICKLKRMDLEKNEIVTDEATELCSVIEMPYSLVSVSEFAKLHQVSEKQVMRWIDSGKLSGAIYQDGNWSIPELHTKPSIDIDDMRIGLDIPESCVKIPDYPLLSNCRWLEIIPDGKKYLVQYYSKDGELMSNEHVNKEEKDDLMGKLLKEGVAYDCFAYQIANLPIKKHFDLHIDQWHDIPSCEDKYSI